MNSNYSQICYTSQRARYDVDVFKWIPLIKGVRWQVVENINQNKELDLECMASLFIRIKITTRKRLEKFFDFLGLDVQQLKIKLIFREYKMNRMIKKKY